MNQFIAFEGHQKLAQGSLPSVAAAIAPLIRDTPSALIHVFNQTDGRLVDLHLHGDDDQITAWLEEHYPAEMAPAPKPRGRGRPKLGVVSREVTLLPRQWDWLASQPGGASVTLRKLVDAARNAPDAQLREAQDTTYRFIQSIAGDLAGFEDAVRALYAHDKAAFAAHTHAWPVDVREETQRLAAPAFK